jgi:hypothetical protein
MKAMTLRRGEVPDFLPARTGLAMYLYKQLLAAAFDEILVDQLENSVPKG